jgi:glutamate carboxypeptidase
MGGSLSDLLQWVDAQDARLRRLVAEWAAINSGSYHQGGLRRCTDAVAREFRGLGGDEQWLDLPPQTVIDDGGRASQHPLGQAVRIAKRPDARRKVLLAIHVDTVYGADDPFQTVTHADPNTLRGPGVVDAKGGLAVMLAALEALERSPLASRIGWTVLINPDEELGSPGSGHLFEKLAKQHDIGLLFEPALPDGSLVASRKGSGNFTAVLRGRSAHAGRDFTNGRNAIAALAELVVRLHQMNDQGDDLTVNVGRINGGGAVNVVPDLAVCRFNVRVTSYEQQRAFEDQLRRMEREFSARDGYRLSIDGSFTAPPKVLDAPTSRLLDAAVACGRGLGLSLGTAGSGGTCDGNRLAAAGLPNLDSLGPRGGNLHSPDEFLLLDSLTERAKLAALLLMRLAAGDVPWPRDAREGRH